MKKVCNTILGMVTILALIIAPSAPLVYAAAPSYNITITEPVQTVGMTVNLTGIASASNYVGQQSAQHVAIWWTAAALSGAPDEDITIPSGPSGAFSGNNFSYQWNASHAYPAAGGFTITAKVCHVSCTGNEGSGDSVDTSTVIILPPNGAPALSDVPASAIIPELSAYTFDATATDTDIPVQSLTFSLSGAPAGAVINSSTGVFSWTPTEAQGPGDYTFSVSVSDGFLSDTKPVTLHVTEVNQVPVASDASVSTHLDTPVSITLSGNDADVPANTLSYSLVGNSTNGALALTGVHTYLYTPNTGFTGSDSFTYKVNDGTAESTTATVSITVSNDAPVLDTVADATIDELTTLSFGAVASDPNADTLTYSLTDVSSTGATLNASTGAFSFSPTEAQGPGVYTFTISATDGGATASTTFTINVKEVNVAPTADAKSVTTDEDTVTTITLSGSDGDIVAQPLTFAKVTDPAHGSVSVVGAVATYTPNLDYNGSDSFTYTVSDGVTDSLPATVSITLSPVNDAPTIALTGSGEVAIPFDGAFEDEGAVCSDVDGEILTPVVTGSVESGTVGVYTLTYTCTDAGQASVATTRTVTVQEAPAACMDGKDNDKDSKTDYPADPGCSSANDNDETDPIIVVVTPPTGGGGGSAPLSPSITSAAPQVLGASTSCGMYLSGFMKKGGKNNKEQVKKLQTFLNDYLVLKPQLPVNGIFGVQTLKAVVKFQEQEADLVLKPWVGVTLKDSRKGTGWVYKTTVTRINNIMCPELNLPTPPLTIDR